VVKVKKLFLGVPVEPPIPRLKVMTGAENAVIDRLTVSLNIVPVDKDGSSVDAWKARRVESDIASSASTTSHVTSG
jgi:hypothetical protein